MFALLGLVLLQGAFITGLSLLPATQAHAASGLPSGCEYPPEDEPDNDGDECYLPPDLAKSQGQNCDSSTNASASQPGQTCGDPINDTTGNVFESQRDFIGAGSDTLSLTRSYNSQSTQTGPFGAGWSFSYGARIQVVSSSSVRVIRPDNRTLTFTDANGVWSADADVNGRLEKTADGWRYTTGDNTVESYDASGRLLSITPLGGLTQTLAYDGQGRLQTVTGAFGRPLSFAYDADGRIASATDPAGETVQYGYDANNNLISVTYPDGTSRHYLYENTAFPHALTGLIDENGMRYSTWSYDDRGRAISSEHADGIGKVTVSYNFGAGVTRVTDALGHSRSFDYLTAYGIAHTLHSNKPSASGYGTVHDSWYYDDNGNIGTYVDFLGHRTTYGYDSSRNLQTSRTEAAGTAEARTVTTQWNANFRLPALITEPGRQTAFSYDSVGHLTEKTITDTGTGAARTWRYSYNSQGLLAAIDGPRTDVKDITTFRYDPAGNLVAVVNALGQTTTINAYDADGRPLAMTDPNGLTTRFSYDARGQLTGMVRGNEATTFQYDNAGELIKVVRPDGSFLAYTYDGAHRLIGVRDSLGNRIVYTRDAADNLVRVERFDPQGTLTKTRSAVFDQLNRLSRTLGAQGQTTRYRYNNDDKVVSVTDPRSNVYSNTFDALNRLVQQTDPNGGTTRVGYDAQGQVNALTDPDGNTTSYQHDGFGDRTSMTSPDTGTTTFTYDPAGDVLTKTDAKGQTTHYRYDVLNRLVGVTYADGLTAHYTYDQGHNGIGHLTRIDDSSGSTDWRYDRYGRVIRKVQRIDVGTWPRRLVTGFRYNRAGRLVGIRYPSGLRVGYQWSQGRITAIRVDGYPVLDHITYQPFGPVNGWTWGDGTASSRSYDLDGRVTQLSLGDRIRQLSYDLNGNLTGIDDSQYGARSFDYDALNRLLDATGPSLNRQWTYDANGNRLSATDQGVTTAYRIDPASNRLLQSGTTAYQYDADGNRIDNGSQRFTYAVNNRLSRVTDANGTTVATYAYNALGQRVYKGLPSTGRCPRDGEDRDHRARHDHDQASDRDDAHRDQGCRERGAHSAHWGWPFEGHDETHTGSRLFDYSQWRLLGEYNTDGRPVEETIWLGNRPVATVRDHRLYYIHTDHLGTPRVITEPGSGRVVWQWRSGPFGTGQPDEDPSGTGRKFVYNLRFAGQYYDSETGTAYNGFRDYDPGLGRYVESDPIGLKGGMNTYLYAAGNPGSNVDPNGHVELTWGVLEGGLGESGAAIGGASGSGLLAPIGVLIGGIFWPSTLADGTLRPYYTKPPRDAKDPNGAKAPGKPGQDEGFEDPKGGEEWVGNPNPGKGGSRSGWKDGKGRVWCPTGKGGRAHGGPHWDVQLPGGGYINVRPGQNIDGL